ncbi:MAG: tetratricopeptide repeat protein [Bacteroidales bacterium]|nr:tetratricopeptide repeat protein [Bacteroidales bacterium]
MLRNYLLVTLLFLSSCSNSEFSSNKSQNASKTDSINNLADSLYELGQIYSEDSLNQKKAQEAFYKSFELYKQLENKLGMANNYKWIGYTYDYLENFEKEKEYLKKALEIYNEIDDKKQSAIVMKFLGIAYTITGDLDSALMYFKNGIEISAITRDTMEIIEGYQNIGIAFQYSGDYEKASENHIAALKYCEEIEYLRGIFSMNNNIAQDFLEIEDLDKALYYCIEASEIIDSIDDPYSKASHYHTMAQIYYGKLDYIKAREYYQKTLDISLIAEYKRGIAAAYTNLASMAIKENKFNKAEKLAKLSLNLEREINNAGGEILSLKMVAETQYNQYRYREALSYLKEAEEICLDKKMGAMLPDIYYHYFSVYKLNKQFKEALQFYEKYTVLTDSLKGVEVKEKIADIEIKYETEKQQQEIILLNKENENKKQKLIARNRLIISLILLVIVIISIAYFFRQRGMQKLNQMESELQKYLLKIKDIAKENVPEITSKEFAEKHDLTERETEVLHLISEGMSNADIAEKIFVSTNTIKYHIKNIYIKLDVKNRVEALNKLKQ